MPLEPKYRAITIERKTGGDFSAISWSDITAATDKAYIQPVSGNEVYETGKGGEKIIAKMFAPMTNTAVQYGDRITQDSQKYLVVYSIQPKGISAESHHREISLGAIE
jgi:hypothetical protein